MFKIIKILLACAVTAIVAFVGTVLVLIGTQDDTDTQSPTEAMQNTDDAMKPHNNINKDGDFSYIPVVSERDKVRSGYARVITEESARLRLECEALRMDRGESGKLTPEEVIAMLGRDDPNTIGDRLDAAGVPYLPDEIQRDLERALQNITRLHHERGVEWTRKCREYVSVEQQKRRATHDPKSITPDAYAHQSVDLLFEAVEFTQN